MNAPDPILKVTDLAVSRGGRILFQGLSFSAERNALVTIEGRNGAGKTTLLDCISGLRNASAGSIRCNAQRVTRFLQRRAGFWNLTALESVKVAMLAGKPLLQIVIQRPMDLSASAASILKDVGLQHKESSLCSTLAGGEVQRLKFAQIIASGSDLVLLDEPFNDIDARSIERGCALISSLLRTAAVILVTHFRPQELPGSTVINL